MRKKQAKYGFFVFIGAIMLAFVATLFQGHWFHDEVLISSPTSWSSTSLSKATPLSIPLQGVARAKLGLKGARENHQQSLSSTSPVRVADFLDARVRASLSKDRYVHVMHLDGFNAEVFRKMLAAGQLPHFQFLAEHGRLSTRATTVDKSETMKVIPSVLSSKVDTRIAGWWQFDRSQMSYSNFWLDPVEVVNYALGLDFPLYPTMLDVLARDHQTLVSGFGLFRRSVPFENYSRAYLDGADAVSSFRYYNQANASMTALLDLLGKKIAAGDPPRLTTSLLAAADEMTHLNGLTSSEVSQGSPKPICMSRAQNEAKPSPLEDAFKIVESHLRKDDGLVFADRIYENGSVRRQEQGGPFYGLQMDGDRLVRLCFNLPSVSIQTAMNQKQQFYLYPEVTLAYMIVDLEVGRLINGLRQMHLPNSTSPPIQFVSGIENYLRQGQLEDSMFEKTLFLFYGDHGMVNTFNEMSLPLGIPAERINRQSTSLSKPFSQVLAESLGLSVFVKGQQVGSNQGLVVDYENLPPRLKSPHAALSWQNPETLAKTAEAKRWADEFFDRTTGAVRSAAYQQYRWLTLLRPLIIDPIVNSKLAPIKSTALELLQSTYLKGDEKYRRFLIDENRSYYDLHVKLVYGGSALNNADLFLPKGQGGSLNWGPRPDFKEIMGAFNGQLIPKLLRLPGVGLIFVRLQNAEIEVDGPVPARIDILVMDRSGNRGTISVALDRTSKEKIYHYQVQSGSRDPLGYEAIGSMAGRFGTYSQWSKWSNDAGLTYQNAVGGMGSYLYSSSPAIGDITITHDFGWNFGENLGGHGGIEAGEKLTVMLMSGPGVNGGGELMAQAAWSADGAGRIQSQSFRTYPSVLDVAPSALGYLGYPTLRGEGELTRFSRNGFAKQLAEWTRLQKASCDRDGINLVVSLGSVTK